MIEGLEKADVNILRAVISAKVNDLAIVAAGKRGQGVSFEYGQISGLVEAIRLLDKAQEGDL